jgi:hypothetical protein
MDQPYERGVTVQPPSGAHNGHSDAVFIVWGAAGVAAIQYGILRWRDGERWLGGASIALGMAICLALIALWAFPDLAPDRPGPLPDR